MLHRSSILIVLLVSAATGFAADRVYLYGGPGSLEGTFEDANGAADRQGWVGVDLTDVPPIDWRRSQFNAENLDGNGVGNHALWVGRTAAEEPGWTGGTGYANDWDTAITWSSGPLDDPSVGRTVDLDFVFNLDTEENYDFVSVHFQRGPQWFTAWRASGTNGTGGVFAAPGLRAADQTVIDAIEYFGDDYAGPNGDEIVLRIHFRSDGAYSDEDGQYDSVAGAVQVDDVTVTTTNGGAPLVSTEDFEGAGPFAWTVVPTAAVGDFSKVLRGLTDPDPCHENPSPQMTFIDDGTPPSNRPGQSTGGSTNLDRVDYGTPEGFTLNYTGGVAGYDRLLENEVWSPVIALDAPGSEDDAPGWATFLSYRMFHDYRLGFTGHYSVRTSPDGSEWSPWTDAGFVYFHDPLDAYYESTFRIDAHFLPDAAFVQIALRAFDEEVFDDVLFDGVDLAGAGPWFDDVAVYKERLGPTIAPNPGRSILADAFPTVDAIDVSTPAARDLLDVDPRRDGYDPSTFATLYLEPHAGAALADARVEWILEKNPLFEDAIRTMPAGTSSLGGDRWAGSFPITVDAGGGNGFFGVPASDFMYPGDVLRYHVVAEADDGLVSTEPRDLTGFDTGAGWPEDWTVRGLPTFENASGAVPSILVVTTDRDSDRMAGALRQNGLVAGQDFDLLAFRRPDSGPLTERRASAAQLQLYPTLIVDVAAEFADTIDDDVALLDAWVSAPGDRFAAWIGRDVLAGLPVGQRETRFGFSTWEFLDSDDFDGVRIPALVPQADGLTEIVGADRTCRRNGVSVPVLVAGAVAGHAYESTLGGPVVSPAATVVYDRVVPEGRRLDVTIPLSMSNVATLDAVPGDGRSAAARLMRDVLDLFGAPAGGVTSTPPIAAGLSRVDVAPNPFNPSTTIRFTLGRTADVQARIYNLRGELVRTLHDGRLPAGEQTLRWDGRADGGDAVASGVYLLDVQGIGTRRTAKLALLK